MPENEHDPLYYEYDGSQPHPHNDHIRDFANNIIDDANANGADVEGFEDVNGIHVHRRGGNKFEPHAIVRNRLNLDPYGGIAHQEEDHSPSEYDGLVGDDGNWAND
jgi:hypothetical protein